LIFDDWEVWIDFVCSVEHGYGRFAFADPGQHHAVRNKGRSIARRGADQLVVAVDDGLQVGLDRLDILLCHRSLILGVGVLLALVERLEDERRHGFGRRRVVGRFRLVCREGVAAERKESDREKARSIETFHYGLATLVFCKELASVSVDRGTA